MLQHTVLPVVMLEKWKNAVDKGKCVGTLKTDLSNAFDCLSHKLLIAKLHAYSFDLPALKPKTYSKLPIKITY